MPAPQPVSRLREFWNKLASISILLLPAAGCATLNIMAILAGGGTWLVWLLACGSSAFVLWLLNLLLPDHYPYFADDLNPDHPMIFAVTRGDREMTGAGEAPDFISPSE